MVEHKRVETVAAQILLAQTTLVLDANGAYRGTQTYWIDNKTEPYLVVELPAGAMLWSALVASEPVKPVKGDTLASVKIPLIRTRRVTSTFPWYSSTAARSIDSQLEPIAVTIHAHREHQRRIESGRSVLA